MMAMDDSAWENLKNNHTKTVHKNRMLASICYTFNRIETSLTLYRVRGATEQILYEMTFVYPNIWKCAKFEIVRQCYEVDKFV